MHKTRDDIKAALAEVRSIYAELAKRPIERRCEARTECCQFRLTGLTPQLTKGEALLAAKAFRATGRKSLPEPAGGVCPLLKPETGRCLIYADRPFGCRTHFCAAAGGPYLRKEVLDLIRRLEAVDEQLGGDGPHAIQTAVADALREMSATSGKAGGLG
jgi:Fe-S-cluster containining protein